MSPATWSRPLAAEATARREARDSDRLDRRLYGGRNFTGYRNDDGERAGWPEVAYEATDVDGGEGEATSQLILASP